MTTGSPAQPQALRLQPELVLLMEQLVAAVQSIAFSVDVMSVDLRALSRDVSALARRPEQAEREQRGECRQRRDGDGPGDGDPGGAAASPADLASAGRAEEHTTRTAENLQEKKEETNVVPKAIKVEPQEKENSREFAELNDTHKLEPVVVLKEEEVGSSPSNCQQNQESMDVQEASCSAEAPQTSKAISQGEQGEEDGGDRGCVTETSPAEGVTAKEEAPIETNYSPKWMSLFPGILSQYGGCEGEGEEGGEVVKDSGVSTDPPVSTQGSKWMTVFPGMLSGEGDGGGAASAAEGNLNGGDMASAHRHVGEASQETKWTTTFPQLSSLPLKWAAALVKEEAPESVGPVKGPRGKCFRCEWCNKTFPDNFKLVRHIRIHTGERPFKCPECPKAFARPDHLTGHLRMHTGERPFRCETCGKAFALKDKLTVHRRTHSTERPFCCTQCGKAFKVAWKLKKHMRLHMQHAMM